MNTRQESGLAILVALLAVLVVGGAGTRVTTGSGRFDCPQPLQVGWQERELVLCDARWYRPVESLVGILWRCSLPGRPNPGQRLAVAGRAGAACRLEQMSGRLLLDLGLTIDVNRATASDLEALPGIGPTLARRIVAKRAELGGFSNPEQLQQVRGIGPARMRRMTAHLLFSPVGAALDDDARQTYNTGEKPGVPEGSTSRDLDTDR